MLLQIYSAIGFAASDVGAFVRPASPSGFRPAGSHLSYLVSSAIGASSTVVVVAPAPALATPSSCQCCTNGLIERVYFLSDRLYGILLSVCASL